MLLSITYTRVGVLGIEVGDGVLSIGVVVYRGGKVGCLSGVFKGGVLRGCVLRGVAYMGVGERGCCVYWWVVGGVK